MDRRDEVFPTGIAQGLHQIPGKPEFNVLLGQALAEFVKAGGELGHKAVGHGVCPGVGCRVGAMRHVFSVIQ
jgi:hypothetical protein